MVESARDVCDSVSEEKNPKSVWLIDVVKAAVERKAMERKGIGARDEVDKEEKRKVKRYIYTSKKEVSEQGGKMINQDGSQCR